MGEANSDARIRVVLADDHTLMRDGTRLILQAEHDIEVVAEAEDGEDAVRLCKNLRPDVILLDTRLKGMNGVEAAKRIRIAAPECAILALSGYDYEPYIKAMLRAGASGYLLKSESGPTLIEAIRLIAAGGSPFSVSIARTIIDALGHNEPQQPPGQPSEHDLDEREFQVLRFLAKGQKVGQIAEHFSLPPSAVAYEIRRIVAKLGASSQQEAVLLAKERGLLEIDELDLGEED